MEQKTETSFKITRFPSTAMVCDYLVEIAAKSNGLPQNKKMTMDDLIAYAKCEILRTSSDGYTISVIDEHHLIIDRRQEPALEIIEVEIINLSTPPPLDDYSHSAN